MNETQRAAPPSRRKRPVTGRRLESFDVLAPGTRILVRDEEWLVRRVDRTSTGGQAVRVVGVSELVREKEALFLTEIEPSIEVLDPADTRIVVDPSPSYSASLLYMESLLRQTPPTDDKLYIGQHAAMDAVKYQLEPAAQALQQPRQRILIADAVGLGKTLECGVLLSELIRRGKGKRILVLAIKSMLAQFQKELWARFTIPLTRLDSVGIQRIRRNIPANHNPFYYYDRSIISIDTLKQDAEYRTWLEAAYWDIIVIDEAHNVALRGAKPALRSRLAQLLSTRSDTLIMLSATPHDGKARSFASLMNMLDPTAIANPEDYGPEDIKGLYIRRFKHDIQDQVRAAFQERQISVARCQATEVEEGVFQAFVETRFARLSERRGAPQLFKTTLEKALFSSPQACLETIENRLRRLEEKDDPEYASDRGALKDLAAEVASIDADSFSKYQRLLEVIRDPQKGLGWNGRDPRDRLVIFTERLRTMSLLREWLTRDLKLPEGQVETLEGTMSDQDQMKVVEDFGRDEAPVRLLIASDVASEGINLHFLCHKMVHFDIPWSLMVFKQRNGRIDRYGQDREPRIVYLVTESQNPKIKGDTRILELLIEKDQQAEANIGDPSTWMGVYDIDTEEAVTARAIEDGLTPEQFEERVETERKEDFDPVEALMRANAQETGERAEEQLRPLHTLFSDDRAYLEAALRQIQATDWLQVTFAPDRIDLTAPEDLEYRFRFLPNEVWPEEGQFSLSPDRDAVQNEIRRCRKDEQTWPQIHYLWPLNPVVEWANDKVLTAFGRHEAPMIALPAGVLEPGETVFVVSGLIPNRKSHPLVHTWFGVKLKGDAVQGIEEFSALVERTGLARKRLSNRGDSEEDAGTLQAVLPQVVEAAREHMRMRRREFEDRVNPLLDEQLKALEGLKRRHHEQIELRFADSGQPGRILRERKDQDRRRVDAIFADYLQWVEDTMTTEDNPYIQVIAALTGAA